MRSKLTAWLKRPAFWVALALLIVGALAVHAGRDDKLREWAPNIAVSAFALAITITVVEWIVRTEARARVRPRLDRVIYWMGLAFRGFTGAIAIDYAGTHRDSFKEIPPDAGEMFAMWLAEQDNEDRPRHVLPGERLPTLILSGREFGQQLEIARARDLDVLDPNLVAVIDKFRWHVGQAVQCFDLAAQGLGDAAGLEKSD